MGKGPKLGLSFLTSIQICRPNHLHLSTLVNTPIPIPIPPLLTTKAFDISLPTLQTPPSSPHHHLSSTTTQHDSKPCTTKSSLQHKPSTQEASHSRTKREGKENMHQHHSPSSSANHQRNMSKPRAQVVKAGEYSSSSPSLKNSCSNPSEEEPVDRSDKSVKQRRARTRRFKRYGSKDWTDGGTRKLVNELPEKPVSGRPGRRTENKQVVNESFVVVKRSSDPYEDFKKSMLEMILEREILEPKDLEELLMSFLSLNSRMHHEAILKAFSDIWNQVFL